ncbi:MAG: endolytic transglycosylase MltG [Marinobacter sp.]|uniref:endolytic transglycosylase MltG n=1 Tax=Marinobacter sp. AC-23 TaxID=1879031 RepID=UPI0008DCA943|nr:endolytic transglycosylase MltG [Marinobacter sp. AC-23]OHY73146.1 BCR, YceG family protein [Marinobacter sp. AC-23]
MFKKLLVAVICAAVLVGAGTGLWVWQGLGSLSKPVFMTEPVLFDVSSGTAFSGVARQLETRGLVEKSLWVRIYGRLYPDQAKIKAGEYEFTDGMTAEVMLEKMVEGDTKHWSVQFIEGWAFSDMRAALASTERLEKLTAQWSDAQIMEAVGAAGEHPEGRFFPDTYLFTSSESDLDLLQRSFQRMENVLAEEWEGREEGLPYDSAYEALIMASIVERETGAPHERGQVAGVFVRRLQKGMRLQTDPTVIYGMGDKYKGRIGTRDLRTHTPYNTYRINGLPPTPIALPGREAIHASLHPDSGSALYFVARGDGTHKFSDTLAEHQKAVRAFQLNRRSDYRSSPAVKDDKE